MSPEKEKKIIPEKERLDVLEKISIIIEKEGEENLEKPEVKEKIVRILEGLFEQSEQEEKTKKNEYDREIAQTVEGARNNFEKEWAELSEQPILDAETQTSQVIQQMTAKLEKIEPEPVVQEYLPVKETKVKTLLAKAGGLFKKSSTLRRLAGILSLSILFSTGTAFAAEKASAEEITKEIKSGLIVNDEEIARIQKEIKTEEFKEFNQNYFDWDVQGLSQICEKMKFIKQRFPECWRANEIGFVLIKDDPSIANFISRERVRLYQEDKILFLNQKNARARTNSLSTLGQYLGREINSFKDANKYALSEYLCVSHTEYVIEGIGQGMEAYYQLTFTVINTEGKTINGQFSIKVDPERLEDVQYQEAIHAKILEQANQLKTKRKKWKLPASQPVEKVEPQIILNQEKFGRANKQEQELYKKTPECFTELSMEIRIDTKEGPKLITFNPIDKDIKKPIKILGKLGYVEFTIPGSKGHSLFLNGKLIEPFIGPDDPEQNQKYRLGTVSKSKHKVGTLSGPSQEKEVIFSVKDKNNNEIARLAIEQIQEWFMDIVYYQNVNNQLDSVGIYCTDPDTLKTYNYFGKEKMIEGMKSMMEGAIEVEEFFNLDMNIEEIKMGSFTDYATAFLELRWGQDKTLGCLAPKIEKIDQWAPDKELWRKNFFTSGRHEMLHKLDFILNDGSVESLPFISETDSVFGPYFERLRDEYTGLDQEQKKQHLFSFVKESNFYHELNNPDIGHPKDHAREFFVSTLNTVLGGKEKLKTEFQKWPMEIKKQYIETLIMVEKMIRRRGTETQKLQETIQYLIDLRTGKIK